MSIRRRPEREHKFTVIPGEGKKPGSAKETVTYYILLLVVVALVVQSGYHWLGSSLLARRLQIVTAEPGFMDQTIEMEGFIVRSEQVVIAPSSGIIVEMAPPGERVTPGTPLVTLAVLSAEEIAAMTDKEEEEELPGWWETLLRQIERRLNLGDEEQPDGEAVFGGEIPSGNTEQITVTSAEAGLLSYHLDGWEAMDQTALQTIREDHMPTLSRVEIGSVVKAGQPILKIVDNWSWSFHLSLPPEQGRELASLEQVEIVFDFAPLYPVTARLLEAVSETKQGRLQLTYLLEQQLPGFDEVRRTKAKASVQRLTGLIVPAAALLEQEGETGVFINSGGVVTFKPVIELRLQGEEALIEGIEPYSMVISNPELVTDGQRLN